MLNSSPAAFENVTRAPLYLAGISDRTNLHKELNTMTAIIGKTIQSYAANQIASKISGRINPGVTFCVYTDYESDYRGDYTYFIGEEMDEASFLALKQTNEHNLSLLVIPQQRYLKITTPQGPMPKVCIEGWQWIWQQEQEGRLSGTRAYKADFEVYDGRATSPMAAVLDIFVGLRPA